MKKYSIKHLLIIVLVPLIITSLALFAGFYLSKNTTNNYFLTRYNTQAELVSDFLDIVYYDTDTWYRFLRTNADGSTVSVSRGYDYHIEKTVADGTQSSEDWDAVSGGVYNAPWGKYADLQGDVFYEVVGSANTGDIQTRGYYYKNDQGLINLYQLSWGNKPTQHQNDYYRTELFYDDQARIVKQLQENEKRDEYRSLLDLTPEESALRYVSYSYDSEGKVIRAEQYNYKNELVSYTDYVWEYDYSVSIACSYDVNDNPIKRCENHFDNNGRLHIQKFYDGPGNLQYTVEFFYDVASFMYLPNNIMILSAIWIGSTLLTGLYILFKKSNYEE